LAWPSTFTKGQPDARARGRLGSRVHCSMWFVFCVDVFIHLRADPPQSGLRYDAGVELQLLDIRRRRLPSVLIADDRQGHGARTPSGNSPRATGPTRESTTSRKKLIRSRGGGHRPHCEKRRREGTWCASSTGLRRVQRRPAGGQRPWTSTNLIGRETVAVAASLYAVAK